MTTDPFMRIIEDITGHYEERTGRRHVDWEMHEQIAQDRQAVLAILSVMLEANSAAPAVDALTKLIDDARRGMS